MEAGQPLNHQYCPLYPMQFPSQFRDVEGASRDERMKGPITHIEQFATAYRLRVSRDACGDPIIQGKRGHLYFDGEKLCAMFIDTPVIARRRLLAVAGAQGSLWLGDISRDRTGRRVQDIELRGIPPDKYHAAIQIVGAKPKRILSEAQKAVLEKARAASPLFQGRAPDQRQASRTASGPSSASGHRPKQEIALGGACRTEEP
jgi:hypothetical protein